MSLDSISNESQSRTFTGFRCWARPDATRVLDREAAAASRELLLATHVEPPIRQVSASAAGQFNDIGPATQADLLKVVLHSTDDSLVVPIVGASGSGKSHLVLWLRAQLDEQAAPERYRLIYVPKSKTSLSGVIELILEGLSGGAYDNLRDDVRAASGSMSARARALRLRNELALRIDAAEVDPDDTTRAQTQAFLKTKLPALLNDATYERRLLSTGGALQRLVDETERGGNEQQAEFTEDDLPLDLDPQEQADLGAMARQLLGLLENPTIRAEAVAMMNAHRDFALSSVFGVAPMQLLGVFEDLRREIQRDRPGQRLVLMIEDFTLLQGIQHDLLEAMIANARPDGGDAAQLAPMTTVVAVTKGFLQRVFTSSLGGDTVRTRIASQGHIYSLDSPYGDDAGYEREQVIDFVGRYLNAVRVTAEGVVASHPNIPNACAACHHQDRCHEGFGTSAEGYGLYPFNARSLDRMVRGRRDDFNPRDMLSALQQTLTNHAQEIEDGTFPSPSWAKLFDPRANNVRANLPTLSLVIQRRAEGTPKGQQREVLLTFWGGVPEELGDLDPAVHEAFAIPRLGNVAPPPPEPEPAGRTPPRPPVAHDVVGERVQAWRDGERMNANDAREVRRLVSAAVLESLGADRRLLSKDLVERHFSRERDISIENAQGGGGRGTRGGFSIQIGRDREGVDLVEGVLRAVEGRGRGRQAVQNARWDYPDGFDRLALLLEVGVREAERLAHHLRTQATLERKEREARICALYFSGVVLNAGGIDSTEEKVASLCRLKEAATEHLPPRLQTLYKRLSDQRAIDRELVFADGQVRKGSTGSSLGFDTSEALKVVRAFERDWALPPMEEDFNLALLNLLHRDLEPALEQAHEELLHWRAAVEDSVGVGVEWSAVAKEVRAASKTAAETGYAGQRAPAADVPSDTQIASAVRKVDAVLDTWESTPTYLRGRALTDLPWARLRPVRDELENLRRHIVKAIEKAEAVASGASSVSALGIFESDLESFERLVTDLSPMETA